ncbi:MAG TPA: HAD-IIIC family phosphatase [Bryobacteraceae bacterium]|nr:HAD-IIIC family phosphatase [Bryobacteraceae bacterium]
MSTTPEPKHIQRFRVSATFNADPLQRVLEFWASVLGALSDIDFAPYNQPLQTLLNHTSVFAQNRDGVNALLVRWEDLGQFASHGETALAQIENNAKELLRAVRGYSETGAPLLFCVCPPSTPFAKQYQAFLNRLNELAAASLDDVPGVHQLDPGSIAQWYQVEFWDNPHGHELGRIPYTELYFVALGTAIVRLALSIHEQPYKVIALDCDNTLWRGICGEDGPDGITVDDSRLALQRNMLAQREAGMLLTIASKNNERDVIETFAANPAMPLRPAHFAARRINWENKSVSLASIAAELDLGLDSFIFIDDNPMECAEVKNALPEVLCLALPDEDDAVERFLQHVWALDHPVLTEEDLHRNAYYAQSQQFGEALRGTANLRQFYAALNLRVEVKELGKAQLARAAQLTQRTNQFNVSSIRRTESELWTLAQSGHTCLTVEASDRFGDYGTVGVAILRETGKDLVIDTYLLSCRALGRGVEHWMMREIGRIAVERSLDTVVARLLLSAKNLPARQFLESIGSGWQEQAEGGFVFRIPAAAAATVEWEVDAAPAPASPAAKTRRGRTRTRLIDYERIARTLATPEQILEEMRRTRISPRGTLSASNPPIGETETRLATIWCDLLQTAAVNRDDNFFDLGGHSLLAVMLLVRVKEAFDVELPIDDVYSSIMTLSSMAADIDARALGIGDQDEYASLLAEIEGLTDEEARVLLEEERSGTDGR